MRSKNCYLSFLSFDLAQDKLQQESIRPIFWIPAFAGMTQENQMTSDL
jgi:hypothetical protein